MGKDMKKNINFRMNRIMFVDESVIYIGAGENLRKMLRTVYTRGTVPRTLQVISSTLLPASPAGRCHCTDFIEDKTVISPFIHLSVQSPTHPTKKHILSAN